MTPQEKELYKLAIAEVLKIVRQEFGDDGVRKLKTAAARPLPEPVRPPTTERR